MHIEMGMSNKNIFRNKTVVANSKFGEIIDYLME